MTDRCDAVVRPLAPSSLMIFAMRHTGAERLPGRRCHPVGPNVTLALGRSFCIFIRIWDFLQNFGPSPKPTNFVRHGHEASRRKGGFRSGAQRLAENRPPACLMVVEAPYSIRRSLRGGYLRRSEPEAD